MIESHILEQLVNIHSVLTKMYELQKAADARHQSNIASALAQMDKLTKPEFPTSEEDYE